MFKKTTEVGISGFLNFRFALNSAWQESTGYTPAEITLGRKLKGPLERAFQHPTDPDHPSYSTLERHSQLIDLVKANVEKAQQYQRRYYNQRRRNQEFCEGDVVWVRSHPLSKADDASWPNCHLDGKGLQR